MKKRFLSTLMALCLALSLLPATALAAEGDTTANDEGTNITADTTEYVAQVGDKQYETLNAAVAAVQKDGEQEGKTITVLTNIDDATGMSVKSASKFTIDFDEHGYILTGPGAGSPNTETNGFQLLKGSTITLKDGTIRIAENANDIKRVIQNYADLTLENMQIYAQNQVDGEALVLSFNNGNITFKGNTSVHMSDPKTIAFDVYYWAGAYEDGTQVTFDESYTGSIDGVISYDTTNKDKASLTINGNGTFAGISLSQSAESLETVDISITGGTFSSDVTAYLPSGMTQVNGKVVVDTAKAVATVNGVGYDDLQEAIDAAGKGDTVTLLQDEEQDVTIAAGQEITLDLGTYTLKNASGHTITSNGTLTIIGSGTVDNISHGKAAIYNEVGAAATLNGGTYTRSQEAGTSAGDSGNNSYYTILNHGTMTINNGVTVNQGADGNGKYSSLVENGWYNGNQNGTAAPSIMTINGGTFGGGLNTIKNDDYGQLTINGGMFSSYAQACVLNWNVATINDGTFDGTGASNGVVLNGYINATMDKGELTITGGEFIGNAIVEKMDGSNTSGDIQITDGTFNVEAIAASLDDDTLKITGGNYSVRVPQTYLASSVNAELRRATGTTPYSYYERVADATAAAQPGDTVTAVNVAAGTITYQVTFDYGDSRADTVSTVADNTTIILPSPGTRSGYDFAGWYSGNTRYDKGDQVRITSDMTFTASWSERNTGSSGSSSEPSYSPVMDVSDGGSIKVNPRTPEEDDEVTITVDPDSGYEVDEVTVTDRNGREVKVTAERDGTYTFTQPRGRVTISVTFVREGGSTFFSDVPESFWAYDEIAWAYDNGYVNGTSASAFSPNASISRQQVWMILARLSGADPANMSAAREWAVTNGVSDGTTPGGAVTRQQLVALLYRYATLMGYANDQRADLSAYPDAGTVAGYAVEPMQWSVANSIVGGTSNGTLDPTGTATRAQFAVILYRFWDQVG